MRADALEEGEELEEERKGEMVETGTDKVAKSPSVNSFWLGWGNNPQLARYALESRGLKALAKGMQFSPAFRFRWVQTSSEVNFMRFKEGVNLANHLVNS